MKLLEAPATRAWKNTMTTTAKVRRPSSSGRYRQAPGFEPVRGGGTGVAFM